MFLSILYIKEAHLTNRIIVTLSRIYTLQESMQILLAGWNPPSIGSKQRAVARIQPRSPTMGALQVFKIGMYPS